MNQLFSLPIAKFLFLQIPYLCLWDVLYCFFWYMNQVNFITIFILLVLYVTYFGCIYCFQWWNGVLLLEYIVLFLSNYLILPHYLLFVEYFFILLYFRIFFGFSRQELFNNWIVLLYLFKYFDYFCFFMIAKEDGEYPELLFLNEIWPANIKFLEVMIFFMFFCRITPPHLSQKNWQKMTNY